MTTLTKIFPQVISISLPQVNWRKFCVLAIILAVVLMFSSLVFYVIQVNNLTKGSYLIKTYQKEITKLSRENAKLQTNFAEVGFLGSVQEKATELSFEKTSNVKYIQVVAGDLARAK